MDEEKRGEIFETVGTALCLVFFAVGMFFVVRYAVTPDTDWGVSLALIALGAVAISVFFCFFAMIFAPLLALLFGIAELLIIPVVHWLIRRARA